MQANNNIGWSIYEISYPYVMTLTYLKYGKQLTVTFPIFLMKWKRQSSIFFWLNIIYIRTKVAKGILLHVRLPKMSQATAQQILVMLLPHHPPPTPKVKKEWCPHPTFLKRCKRSGEVSNAIFNTPSDTPFYLSVEHQAFMKEKGNRKREEDLRLRPST